MFRKIFAAVLAAAVMIGAMAFGQIEYSTPRIGTSTSFTATGTTDAVGLATIGANYHILAWTKTNGTISSCAVTLEQSRDASDWATLGSSQNCATDGVALTVNSSARYIRANVTTFSGTGSPAL